jgi:hypothetical protein
MFHAEAARLPRGPQAAAWHAMQNSSLMLMLHARPTNRYSTLAALSQERQAASATPVGPVQTNV